MMNQWFATPNGQNHLEVQERRKNASYFYQLTQRSPDGSDTSVGGFSLLFYQYIFYKIHIYGGKWLNET